MSSLARSLVASPAARLLSVSSFLVLACQGAKPPESTVPEAPPEPATAEVSNPGVSAPPSPVPESPGSASGTGVDEAPSTQTLFVREQRVPCQGEAAMQCLQVRNSETEPWRNFYAHIQGFTYEEGHAYELRVEVKRLPNPPMDSASSSYRLIEVVSKQPRASTPAPP